ncbi:hypothetical protein NX059_002896 [Plenodomus lindquistii]|nr:hypothetical protein NX059_002896 [Plenodomus lindquistii]
MAFLASDYLIRVSRILHANFSWQQRTWTQVTLEALPNDATRITFALPRSWRTNPGSSVHIYLPRIALWSSHPFSIAWIESSGYSQLAQEKLPAHVEDITMNAGPSTISCIVRARNGMTRSLYELAASGKADSTRIWGAVEGPYGGYHSLDSYDNVVLFAAGVGITHQLLFMRHLLAGYTNDTVAVRNILLVWCVTTIDCIEWVDSWLEEIASMPDFRMVVRINLHVSRTTTAELAHSSLPTYVNVGTQRCNPGEILDDELYECGGRLAVSVCGPPGFSADVRAAVRERSSDWDIDLFDESFTY